MRGLLHLAGFAGAVLAAMLIATPAAADDPSAAAEQWSVRLMQEKARIERFQKRLDHLNAAYAKAVAREELPGRLRTLSAARQAAEDALAAAERRLPSLVAEARDDGVREEILRPYRYAAPPASTR